MMSIYFFALFFKKAEILQVFNFLSSGALIILNFIFSLAILAWGGSFLWEGRILVFLGFVVVWWTGLIPKLLMVPQLPFVLINGFFISKIERVDFEEDVAKAETLDKNNNVVGLSEGDTAISLRLAKYFVILFCLNLLGMLIFPDQDGMTSYFITPATQVFGPTVIVGFPYAIYRKLRFGRFFQEDKRYFLIKTWKLSVYLVAIYITFLAFLF